MTSSPPKPARWTAVSIGRRLGFVLMWTCTVCLIVFAGGSITYEALFRPSETPHWRASECAQMIHGLDEDLRTATANRIRQPGDGYRPLPDAWDTRLREVKAQCAAHGNDIDRLERLRYGHEAMLQRFELELAPLHVALDSPQPTKAP